LPPVEIGPVVGQNDASDGDRLQGGFSRRRMRVRVEVVGKGSG
jgi:hypothetical protein